MGRNRKTIPARSPESRENELISLAYSEAERRLRDGSASSQIITTLLNLASTKAQLEMEKLRSDLRVADAKVNQMKAQEESKELYEEVIKAFRSYSGYSEEEEYDDYEDEYY